MNRIEEAAAAAQKQATHLEAPLEENLNIRLAQEEQDGVVSARDVGEAISALRLVDHSLLGVKKEDVLSPFKTHPKILKSMVGF